MPCKANENAPSRKRHPSSNDDSTERKSSAFTPIKRTRASRSTLIISIRLCLDQLPPPSHQSIFLDRINTLPSLWTGHVASSNMSTIILSPLALSKTKLRPSTPVRRRCLALLQSNTPRSLSVEQPLLHLLELLKESPDSSTQLLIRLYHHKSPRLQDQPEALCLFQREIYAGLRRLHPALVTSSCDQENQSVPPPQPIVAVRSGQATIRKLH